MKHKTSNISIILRGELVKRNMTLCEFAKHIGVSQGYLCDWLNSKLAHDPLDKIILRIEKFLGMNIGELLLESNRPMSKLKSISLDERTIIPLNLVSSVNIICRKCGFEIPPHECPKK